MFSNFATTDKFTIGDSVLVNGNQIIFNGKLPKV